MRISRSAVAGIALGAALLGATVLTVGAQAAPPTPTPTTQQPDQRGPFGGAMGAMMGRAFADQMGGMMANADWSIPSVAAKLAGLSVTELMTMRHDGKSFAQIVESKGKTAQQLIDAVLAAHKTRLDQAVAEKQMTQAQADAAYKQMSDNVAAMVNSTAAMPGAPGAGPMGGRGRMAGMMNGLNGGCWDGDEDSDGTTSPQRQSGPRPGRGMGGWQ